MIEVKDKICITVKEASELSNIGINTIRKLIEDHPKAFTINVGTKILVHRERFEEFLRSRTYI